MLNLDTHILLHALNGSLSENERRVLAGDRWSISAIVLWEIAKLSQLGRINWTLRDERLLAVLATITVWPISVAVCQSLLSLDFRSDLADELIAATSLAHGVPLVTRDARIRESAVVPLV
jgi:PIN domain nuclease of toxin-antitoxin system